MNTEQVRQANRLVDELEHIERALDGVAPQRVDYVMEMNTSGPCPFHVSGAELHAWLRQLRQSRVDRLAELGVQVTPKEEF